MYCVKCGLTTRKVIWGQVEKWIKDTKLADEIVEFCDRCDCVSGGDISWLEKRDDFKTFYKKYPNDKHSREHSICLTCKFINWHRLIYCYGCGQKLEPIKLTYAELNEKFPDFKVGS